ncbi:mitochondrial pyruvate carrier 3-like isoform X1 [Vitis riparia]|uniref:mitochondrial pyruvate carrier 3-like isoform X1 n=1 Tax=Vitis riparia TaxID=96939 RepID=UPI00155B0377|nr:mitochondrial pyruvate carrier 3-like isoform X1 [Vitis riparia]
MAASKLQAFWNHPAGPKTSLSLLSFHFWAPTFKWGVSIANIYDFWTPAEQLSYPQQTAIAGSGIIWSRYSTIITPKNWNLFSVSVGMAATGMYQLGRKIQHDVFSKQEAAMAKEC